MEQDLKTLSKTIDRLAGAMPIDLLDVNLEVVHIILGEIYETLAVMQRLFNSAHHDLANLKQIHQAEGDAP